MRNLLAALCLLASSSAFAEGLPAFNAVGFAALRSVKSTLPSPAGKAGDVISEYHLIAQAGRTVLFGYASTDAQAKEAVAYWTEILQAAGVSVGAPVYADGMYKLPYATADGRVLRDFMADARQFPPKDEAGLRANMIQIRRELEAAGHPVVSARVLNLDALLPTYSLLYLTKADANPDHEVRLRVLKPGDDLDFDVFRGAGVKVLQTPEPWMMVYLGAEVGYVGMVAKTADDLAAKLAKREEYLRSQGKVLIAHKTFPVDDPDYKFGVALYFFQ